MRVRDEYGDAGSRERGAWRFRERERRREMQTKGKKTQI